MTPSEKLNSIEKIPGVYKLLKKTFAIYFKNFGLYFGYAAWLFIPLVLTIFSVVAFSEETVELLDLVFNIFIYSLLVFWLMVTFVLVTPLIVNKRTIKTREISSEAWTVIIPYLLISLLVSIINFVGLLLLIIPGIVFITWFYFSAIITILEKAHVTSALKRSRELSKGRFLNVFWRIIGGNACIFLVVILLVYLIANLNAVIAGIDLLTYLNSPPSIVDAAIFRVSEIFILPVVVIYQVVLYLELKKTASPAKVTAS